MTELLMDLIGIVITIILIALAIPALMVFITLCQILYKTLEILEKKCMKFIREKLEIKES